jgi:hypothetical protein
MKTNRGQLFFGYAGAPSTKLVSVATIGLHYLVSSPAFDTLRFDNLAEVVLAVMLIHSTRHAERAMGPRRFAAVCIGSLLATSAASAAIDPSIVGPFGLVFSLLAAFVFSASPAIAWWHPLAAIALGCSQGAASASASACGAVIGGALYAANVRMPVSIWRLNGGRTTAAAAAAVRGGGAAVAAAGAGAPNAAVPAAAMLSPEEAERRSAAAGSLVSMGFERPRVERALELANGSVEIAANMLLSGNA